MDNIVPRIDSEIEKRSLLKHSFYKMWSEGKLTIDHLQGYSKEYFQLVKIVPKFVESISKTTGNSDIITNNAREEAEHVELWARFATALGVSRSDLISYGAHCEEDISPKRVNAVPWTPFCIQCQEIADRAQAEGSESFDDLLVNAA